MTELKLGLVNLVDLLKINALLDMEADIQRYAAEHPKKDSDLSVRNKKQKARFLVLNLKLVVPMKNCTRWIVL